MQSELHQYIQIREVLYIWSVTQQLNENDNIGVQIHHTERLHHRRIDDLHPIYMFLLNLKMMRSVHSLCNVIAVIIHDLSLNPLILILFGNISKIVLFGGTTW